MTKDEREQLRETLSSWGLAAQSFAEAIQRALVKFTPAIESFAKIALGLKLENEYEEYCEREGWIPHYAVAKHLQCPFDGKQFENVRKNWIHIRRELFSTYRTFGSEARKDVFNQILKSFSIGAPTVVVRAAILEIEGLAGDFCNLHAKNKQNIRQNYVANAENFMGGLYPEPDTGLLPYKVIMNYSDKVFQNTEAHHYTAIAPVNPNISRHANAHATHTVATDFDALNAILLLHHYALYFHALNDYMLAPNRT